MLYEIDPFFDEVRSNGDRRSMAPLLGTGRRQDSGHTPQLTGNLYIIHVQMQCTCKNRLPMYIEALDTYSASLV